MTHGERFLRDQIAWLRRDAERYLRSGVLPLELVTDLAMANAVLWIATEAPPDA